MGMCPELETLIFHVYCFKMNISLIITRICLKTCMYIAEICVERSLSQNFDVGISFCFMMYRRRKLEKK